MIKTNVTTRKRVVVIAGDSVADGAFSADSIALRLNDSGLDSLEGVAVGPEGTTVYVVGANSIFHARRETDLCIPDEVTVVMPIMVVSKSMIKTINRAAPPVCMGVGVLVMPPPRRVGCG